MTATGLQHRRELHPGPDVGELPASVARAGRARLRLPALRLARDAQEAQLREGRRALPQGARRPREKHGRLAGRSQCSPPQRNAITCIEKRKVSRLSNPDKESIDLLYLPAIHYFGRPRRVYFLYINN